ncbi:MAG: hypothetical protein HFJ40_08140 [Clostridia bacterium]|nr:hypothetical protein [Clostridia bacterium]
MNKKNFINKVVSTGTRELKRNFEEYYVEKKFTAVGVPFKEKQCELIREYLEEINEITLNKKIPFKVELQDGNIVRFSLKNENKKVLEILIKEGW